MSYAADVAESYRRVADFVDKILKGPLAKWKIFKVRSVSAGLPQEKGILRPLFQN
jgi:hypothetical protein